MVCALEECGGFFADGPATKRYCSEYCRKKAERTRYVTKYPARTRQLQSNWEKEDRKRRPVHWKAVGKRKRIGRTQRKNRYKILVTVLLRDGLECGFCGRALPKDPREIHLDHVLPLSKGGLDIFENIQATHAECKSFL